MNGSHNPLHSYDIANKLRIILGSSTLTRDTAKARLRHGYKEVSDCPLREAKAARDAVKSREGGILNHFPNLSTSAPAESLDSKVKSFRVQLRGVADLPSFLLRACTIFG